MMAIMMFSQYTLNLIALHVMLIVITVYVKGSSQNNIMRIDKADFKINVIKKIMNWQFLSLQILLMPTFYRFLILEHNSFSIANVKHRASHNFMA